MIPQCTYPETVKCNLCGATGHVMSACSRRQSAQAVQHQQILRLPTHLYLLQIRLRISSLSRKMEILMFHKMDLLHLGLFLLRLRLRYLPTTTVPVHITRQ